MPKTTFFVEIFLNLKVIEDIPFYKPYRMLVWRSGSAADCKSVGP